MLFRSILLFNFFLFISRALFSSFISFDGPAQWPGLIYPPTMFITLIPVVTVLSWVSVYLWRSLPPGDSDRPHVPLSAHSVGR